MTELIVLGGERVEALDGATGHVVEPASGAPMAEVATGAAQDATRAVDVATRAFEEGAWPRLSARERGRVLTKASFLVRERQERLARARGPQRGQADLGGPR